MRANLLDHIDPRTGEPDCTGLAEDCALEFDHDEWLDDPDHWIWEVAVEVAT